MLTALFALARSAMSPNTTAFRLTGSGQDLSEDLVGGAISLFLFAKAALACSSSWVSILSAHLILEEG